MAERYQPGEYFAKFMEQLPALIQAKDNAKIRQEYLDLSKQKYEDAITQQKLANKQNAAALNFKTKKLEHDQEKYAVDLFNKERDEEQEAIKYLNEYVYKGAGTEWAANNSKYNPNIKEAAGIVLENNQSATSLANTIMMSTDIGILQKIEDIERLKVSYNVGPGGKKNLDHILGLLDTEYKSNVKTEWLMNNLNHPDFKRLRLFSPEDFYKELQEKDPGKDFRDMVNMQGKAIQLLQDESISPYKMPPATKEMYKDVVSSTEERIKQYTTKQLPEMNKELYQRSIEVVRKQYPQYFDKETNMPKEKMGKIVQKLVNKYYVDQYNR